MAATIFFSVWDYVIFVSLFIGSILIGIYFTLKPGKTTTEYLVGNGQMGIFPVTASLISSHFSAVFLLGIATEVYYFGGTFILCIIEGFFAALATAYIYLPVFYEIRCTSIYEYLELRFNKKVQLTASIGYHLIQIIHVSFGIFAPGLIASQATGLGLYPCVVIIGLVCTLYTSLGGIKAVMWNDTFQSAFIFSAVLSVLIIGCIELGGVSYVWQKNVEFNRLDILNFDIDPAARYTVWTMLLGSGINSVTKFATTQPYVQRYLSTSNLKSAKWTVWLSYIGSSICLVIIIFSGMVLFAAYWECDPFQAKEIKSKDQILSYFVLQRIGLKYPGLSGLFAAGLISCAISTLSSSINSLATVTFKQILEPFCTQTLIKRHPTTVVKITSFIYGMMSIAFVPIVQRMGGIFAAMTAFISTIMGPTFAIFTLGMLFPRATPMCAAVGAFVGTIVPTFLLVGAQIYKTDDVVPLTFTNGCNDTGLLIESSATIFNQSSFEVVLKKPDDVFFIFKMSYLWYRVISVAFTLGASVLASYLFGWDQSKEVDPRLIAPIVHKIHRLCKTRKTLKSKPPTVPFIPDGIDNPKVLYQPVTTHTKL